MLDLSTFYVRAIVFSPEDADGKQHGNAEHEIKDDECELCHTGIALQGGIESKGFLAFTVVGFLAYLRNGSLVWSLG